jgi:hypothetical protein
MSLDKDQAQNIIDDFVSTNDAEFKRISFDNPQLFDASIMALDFLSKRFGKSEQMKKVVVEEMKEAKEEETSLDLLPFAIGEKYLSKNSDMILEIVAFTTDRDGEAMVKIKNVSDGGMGLLDVDTIVQSIKDGRWIKVVNEIVETLPFKVGDAFKVSQTQLIFRIEEIKDDNVFIVYEDGLTAVTSINAFETGLKSGYYVPSPTFNPNPNPPTLATTTTNATITLTRGKSMSGDANNKQFLKKQKDIKKLEKEIDGLEALDDEFLDDDNKAYIIEKKKELEALKK